jgi:hypothetical protein
LTFKQFRTSVRLIPTITTNSCASSPVFFKGSASNLGATQLRSAAEKLGHHSGKEGLTGVAEMIAAIKTEFNRASDELKKLTAKA